ncbi:hypothetical protein [Paenibacillus elgii]|uniref:hypothetical protein n=1 Tax=Paenibacillus elgii TaxID=189691 RepID=UPI000FD74A41|nr:hypothetical protein [Paenibacillus elgii]NEN84658.1 hypothetical protein [Paenibacillus elgii]
MSDDFEVNVCQIRFHPKAGRSDEPVGIFSVNQREAKEEKIKATNVMSTKTFMMLTVFFCRTNPCWA